MHCIVNWPGFWQQLFQFGGGLDTFYVHTRIKDVIAKLKENRKKAINEVETFMSTYVSEAYSTYEQGWLLPKLMENEEGALMDLEYRFGFEPADGETLVSLNDFLKHPEYGEKMGHPTLKVKRIYSWEGFFGWQLYRDIVNRGKGPWPCPNCGRILHSGKTGRMCRKA